MPIEPFTAEVSEANSILNKETIANILKAKKNMHFSIPVMKRLFETFIDSAYVKTQELLKATEKNDIALIKFNTHEIKGAAASLNFNEVTALCRQLEDEETTDPQQDHLSIVKELKKKIDQMYHERHTILDHLSELE